MHIHLHALIHYARLLGNVRFLGTMLLMLLIGAFQLDGMETASAMHAAKANHNSRMLSLQGDSPVPIDGWSSGGPAVSKPAGTDPISPVALNTNAHASVFYRLKPGIFMIPRMNRTPKPKSVYRLFVRAPGEASPLYPDAT